MNNLMERLRRFLRHNRIFFETVAATLLALMAIIVAYGQLRTYREQTSLLKLQTEIARQQLIPQFVLHADQKYDEKKRFYTEDVLTVENIGGLAQDFRSDYVVFLTVSMIEKTEKREKRVPINGYYIATFHRAEPKGVMLTIKGNENNSKVGDLVLAYRQLLKEKNAYGDIRLDRFVRLTYGDVLGGEHTDYYHVELITGAKRLEPEQGKALFEEHKNGFVQSKTLEFEKLTADTLINLFN